MNKDSYEQPVVGINPDQLPTLMRASMDCLKELWPAGTGITLMVFDFTRDAANGGLAYISNAERASMVKAMEEFLDRQRRLA